MKIAVISDTHDHLPTDLLEQWKAADEIWHLGDVMAIDTLTPLRALRKPLYVIRGNRDLHPGWPWVIDFRREGFSIRLVHSPPRVAPPGINLVFHGHTHIPRREVIGDAEFFNPGSISRGRRKTPRSWAWLTLEAEAPVGWEVVRIQP